MDSPSNKTLVYLLFIFLGITLFGTSISIIKLGNFEIPLITGYQAGNVSAHAANISAKVNVTIATNVAISFNISVVDFGNGSLVKSPNLTEINTSTGTNPSTFIDPGPLVITNDGNVDVNVSVFSTTAAVFLGGTNPTYRWNASQNESGSCAGTNNLTTTITAFTASPVLACTNLTFPDTNDSINIDIYLGLPGDLRPGYRETLVNASAQRYCSSNVAGCT